MKKHGRHIKPPPPLPAHEAVIELPFWWSLLSTVWATAVVVLYLMRYPVSLGYVGDIVGAFTDFSIFHAYMLQVLRGFGVAAVMLFIMTRGGALIAIDYVGEQSLTKQELWILGSALSVGFLYAASLGVGALHLWNWGVFTIMAVSFCLWEFSLSVRASPSLALRSSSWTFLWKVCLAALAVLYVLGAAAPEIFYDSLHYHLAIPNLFRLEHRVTSVPTMLYANFVMSVQLVYGVALTIGNALSAKAIHVGLSFLLGLGFISFARRFFGTASGWLAALFFFSMPMVAINATTAGTDVAGAFLLFASAFALILALERKTVRSFQLAGALTGIAASTKYPAFVFIPLAAALLVWHFVRDDKKPLREWTPYLFHFIGVALLFLAPILVKNVAFHGNPLYPFGGTVLGHPRLDPVEWHKFISDTSPRDWPSTLASVGAMGRFVAAPWFLSFESQGTVGPVLLMALPFLFRSSRASLAYRVFQRYAALLWLVWLCTSTVPRYCLPALTLTCPLLAEAALSTAVAWGLRWVLLGSLAMGVASDIAVQLEVLFSWQGWQVVAGKVTQEDYLSHQHTLYPTPPYEALRWMNDNLAKDARVLFAGESRSYYLDRPSIPSSIPGPQPIVVWSEKVKTGAELAQHMRQDGVTHIFINLMEALRTESYHEFHWNTASWEVFDDFWTRNTRLIWRKENPDRADPQALYVYELVPEAQAAQPHPPSPNPFIHWKPK